MKHSAAHFIEIDAYSVTVWRRKNVPFDVVPPSQLEPILFGHLVLQSLHLSLLHNRSNYYCHQAESGCDKYAVSATYISVTSDFTISDLNKVSVCVE